MKSGRFGDGKSLDAREGQQGKVVGAHLLDNKYEEEAWRRVADCDFRVDHGLP